MKGLFVFMGGSFRTGGQHSTIQGRPESVKEQMLACQSHVDFMNHLQQQQPQNVNKIECVVLTYHTPYDGMIREIYKNHATTTQFLDHRIGYEGLYRETRNLYLAQLDEYDFVMYIRIDLVLKPFMTEKFWLEHEKVLWPSVCWRRDYLTRDGYPRVCDLMVYVPRARFGLLKNGDPILNHDSYAFMIRYRLLEETHMGFILNTYHDSDSEKDWNPLYWTANRPQTNVWHSPGVAHNGHYNTLIPTENVPHYDFDFK